LSNVDETWMRVAVDAAEHIHSNTSPNPWVGAVVVDDEGRSFTGVTEPDHGRHAEVVALTSAGNHAVRSTLYVTLEPCCHTGSQPPCTEAIIAAGIKRVVIGIVDPDRRVNGHGIARLLEAGIEVDTGMLTKDIATQLESYLHHRRTGRPFVVLKMASTLDGRIAAADGTSNWITGEEARRDVHRLRSRCDAIAVGAGTVRADDPSLTVRLEGHSQVRQPRRIVIGKVPHDARVTPAESWTGPLSDLVAELGEQGCLQLLVEGGAAVAGDLHRSGLVYRYVFYLAPALTGGSSGVPVMSGPGVATMTDLWRGELVEIEQLGNDVKIVVAPKRST
jgi:diaminohydroxyphosphoribosylaminopyrimidine deaminase / 5-amino-6-(5-phosphoribosylamino)uracil reductase